jgi:hypothetical protein
MEGWFDDDAFVEPWGVDPAAIAVPALCLQAEQDRFVPPTTACGSQSASRAWRRGSMPRTGPTLIAGRVPDVQAWLLVSPTRVRV